VKTARWAALSAGSAALSTPDRLADAAQRNVLDVDDASTLHDCFERLLRFRWQSRRAAWLSGQRPTDTVTLADLAPQQRAQLRSIAREVAGIRRKLSYLANTPGVQ
jgi:CBS domain-containing protein